MSYQPTFPEYPALGEPFSPEPATQPDTSFSRGQHALLSIIPATPEQDEDVLLSIKQVFDREQVSLETPQDYADQQIRKYLEQQGIDDDPEDLILATLYLHLVNITPGPWQAQVAHAMTLPQALIGNWQQRGSGSWSDHLGYPMTWSKNGYAVSTLVNLSDGQLADSRSYDGVYRRTSPQVYDASNQVDLDPRAFLEFVWNAQLQAHFLTHLNRFWTEHESDYHLMLKGNVVHAALLQRDEGSLSAEHSALVLKSMMLHPDTSWENTSYRYFAENPISINHTIAELRIYGYAASDIMVFGDKRKADVVLYIPGNSSPLQGFTNTHELRIWLQQQCRDPHKRASLASHFSSADRLDGAFLSGVDTALRGVAAYPRILDQATGLWVPDKIISVGPALYPYPFTSMRRQIKQRFYADARHDIATQSEYYRKQLAQGLEVTVNVIGAIALALPELAPVVAVLGTGLLAVGVGEISAAKNEQETVEGIGRVAFGLLNALPLIGEASQLARSKVLLSEEQLAATEAVERAQQRQAESAQQVAPEAAPLANWPLIDELKVLRPQLDSLQPELRNRLTQLKASSTIRVTGGGKGTFLDNGKLYVNIRHDVYRVEWLEHEQQLRIRSADDPREWGPFLKATEDGYWDIELRFGLRGGNTSFTTISSPPLPTRVVEGIQRQPLIPRVEVTVPLDDIIEEHTRFYVRMKIQLPGEADIIEDEVPVYYDADAATWRTFKGDYAWREEPLLQTKVRWKTGTARDFERVRHRLPVENHFIEYRFPDLPQLPQQTTPVKNEIHMIWVGENKLPDKLSWNIKENADNANYRFILHVDGGAPTLAAIRQSLEATSVEVRSLHDQAFFTQFINSSEGDGFNYFRSPDSPAGNLAAAADFLRYRLIYEYGGIYMDVDDKLVSVIAKELPAAPHDVLLGNRFRMPWNGNKLIGNAHFASHANNPVLKKILETANHRFRLLSEAFKTTPRIKTAEALLQSMSTISEVCGPRVLNDVLLAHRPDYARLMEYIKADARIISREYERWCDAALDHYFPFRLDGPVPIKAGNAHTWENS
ncbi:glycosyltransferase family 32 protein [Pseudomonas sp. NPDC088890]|uniref:glycosyltransferase family 32 protein n=1 Tax=Pseudomonas sp. NPDC088890 TaxID=3364458 RepID=UPI00384B8E87